MDGRPCGARATDTGSSDNGAARGRQPAVGAVRARSISPASTSARRSHCVPAGRSGAGRVRRSARAARAAGARPAGRTPGRWAARQRAGTGGRPVSRCHASPPRFRSAGIGAAQRACEWSVTLQRDTGRDTRGCRGAGGDTMRAPAFRPRRRRAGWLPPTRPRSVCPAVSQPPKPAGRGPPRRLRPGPGAVVPSRRAARSRAALRRPGTGPERAGGRRRRTRLPGRGG